MPAEDGPVLTIRGLSFSYNERIALDNVAFVVRAGTFTALLGPNGAGKTTLFSLICRFYDSEAGSIEICGWDVRKQSVRALSRIGIVFQQPTLDLDLTVLQNLLYFARLHGLSRHLAHERIERELDRFEMLDHGRTRVRHLSGGMRRRIEVARALLHDPALLLLDEPTVGLDEPTRRRIVDHVHGLARDDGVAVLWASHLIDEIAPSDDLVVLDRGQVKATGRTEDITRDACCATLGDAFRNLIAVPTRPEPTL